MQDECSSTQTMCCTRWVAFELRIHSNIHFRMTKANIRVPSPLSETGLPRLARSGEGEGERVCTQPLLLAEHPASATCFWQTASEAYRIQRPYTVLIISSSCFWQQLELRCARLNSVLLIAKASSYLEGNKKAAGEWGGKNGKKRKKTHKVPWSALYINWRNPKGILEVTMTTFNMNYSHSRHIAWQQVIYSASHTATQLSEKTVHFVNWQVW